MYVNLTENDQSKAANKPYFNDTPTSLTAIRKENLVKISMYGGYLNGTEQSLVLIIFFQARFDRRGISAGLKNGMSDL